jgi:RNAse (barnase) inhibitor barstar
MSKHILIDIKKVPDMEALFSLFEEELGRTFGNNLDGLADALADEEDIHIHLSDR